MTTHHGAFDARCQGGGSGAWSAAPERHAPDRVVDLGHVVLDLAVDLQAKTIRGRATLGLAVVPPTAGAIAIDAVAIEIDRVAADGKQVPFVHDGERLIVRPPVAWKRGERHELAIDYHGRPERGLYFIAPDEDHPDRPLQAWTQGQDEDARFWFPCVDHPSQRITSELRVRVPRGYEAVSNGHLAERTESGDEVLFHWVQDVPHATYLVSLVVGRFAVVEDGSGRTKLRYLLPEAARDDAARTFGRTPRMMELFERMFGHPYPYAKYDQVVVSDFTSGGMENTTATVLHESVAVDASVEGQIDRDDLIAHELAHQWFGNLLTCRDWSHAWLNEGFATYAEVLWYEHGESPERAAWQLLDYVRRYRDEAGRSYRRPIVTRRFEAPVDIFDRHLYEKAACVLHHLRQELGDDVFFRGLRSYVASHARGLVETHDVRRAFESESGRNLEPFFDQWIFRAGHPEVEIAHDYDPSKRRLTLDLKQAQSGARDAPYRLRLPCRVYLSSGSPRFVERVFEVSDPGHRFVWELPDDPAGVRVGQGGVPLLQITFPRPEGWLERQLQEDEDLLGRVEAARALGRSGSDRAVRVLAAALRRERSWMGQAEIARALGDARGERARDALVAALDLTQPRARAAVCAALGRFRADGAAAAAIEGLIEHERAPVVRAAAFRALGSIRWPSAPAILTKALWEPSWCEIIGRACLAGLGALKDPKLVPLFLSCARPGEHVMRRVAAIDALAETAEALEAKASVREQLEILLDDRSFHVARAAIEALQAMRDKASLPALDRLASRRFLDPRLRFLARTAIKSVSEEVAGRAPVETLDRLERTERDVRKLRDEVAALERAPAANTRRPRRMRAKTPRKKRKAR